MMGKPDLDELNAEVDNGFYSGVLLLKWNVHEVLCVFY
jgi:hypothetical protein